MKYPSNYKNLQGTKPMGLGAPWANYYLHNWRAEMLTVVVLFFKECPSCTCSSIAKNNAKTINSKNLGLFTWIQSIYWLTKSEIYSNQQIIIKQLNQWALVTPGAPWFPLVPLGPTIIHTTEEMNCCLWSL